MDGGAWRAAVYGVAQTRLKRLSSSSSRGLCVLCFLLYGFFFAKKLAKLCKHVSQISKSLNKDGHHFLKHFHTGLQSKAHLFCIIYLFISFGVCFEHKPCYLNRDPIGMRNGGGLVAGTH